MNETPTTAPGRSLADEQQALPQPAAIALGANLGPRHQTLDQAVRDLGELGLIVARSRWVESEPEGGADQPRYLNGAVLLHTRLGPHRLLNELHNIESRHGRHRRNEAAPADDDRRATVAHAKPSRTLDLDLLWYADLVLSDSALRIPHPRLHRREFVLTPLAEIAPGWIHPVFGRNVSELLRALQEEPTGRLDE